VQCYCFKTEKTAFIPHSRLL